ncbi:unnamed protein product (mitochondrion) [Plasmodiophora brassicae]|uniref:MPN domain-containing protein n=2 Tax=Plasmodiophora brassicae TaxID=37360 RepID=A0A3P3YM30_PLABS|nr:unnamed protein product [Plasmodiophora brassicae]
MASIGVHPLVLLNIADHSARSAVQAAAPARRVGVVFGTQVGRQVEICASSDMALRDDDDDAAIDHDDLRDVIELHKAVYASHEVLGWYTFSSTDAPPGDDAWAIQDEITAYNESPLLLHLQTQGADPAGRLLLHVYTAGTRDKKPTFISAPYTIVTDDAERLSVDFLANEPGRGGANALAAHLRSLAKSVSLMSERADALVAYLERAAGGGGADADTVRAIRSVCAALPVVRQSPLFDAAFLKELNDALLVNELATITQTCLSVQQLADKCRLAFDEGHEPRSKRGKFL